MFSWRYPCNTVVVRKTFSQKTNFYPPRMHLKRRFFYLKETPENHHGILTSQGRYVYTPHPRTGQLLYVRTADDGSPQLYHPLPAVPATPIQPSQPDTSQFSTPKVLMNTWLYHTWLWCFILVSMLFFFWIKLYVHVPTTLYYKHTEYGNPVLKIFMWTKCMVQNYRVNGI